MQVEFWEGSLDETCACKAVVLISKGYGKEFTGMGLVEILWKAKTGIIKQRLTAEITCHGSLHGFWMGWGIWTAILEAKILPQMTPMIE